MKPLFKISLATVSLLSVWTVHLAGYSLQIPSGLRGVLDTYFYSSLLAYFSLVVAASVLAGNYGPLLARSVASRATKWTVLSSLLLSARNRRRLIPIGKRELRLNSYFAKDLEKINMIVRNESILPILVGAIHYSGMASGRAFSRIDRFELPIKVILTVLIFGLIYLSLSSVFLLFLSLLFLYFIVEPNPLDDYLEFRESEWKKFGDNKISLFAHANYKFLKNPPVKKLALLTLTLSFLAGYARHVEVNGSNNSIIIQMSDGKSITAQLIAKTSSGALVNSENDGYIFIPNGSISRIFPFR